MQDHAPFVDPTLEENLPVEQQLSVAEVFNIAEQYSVINLVHGKLREAMLAVPQKFYDFTEGELRNMVKPTQVDYSLRVSFWREFEKCIQMRRGVLKAPEVYGGICTETYFYQRFLRNQKKVAWMCRPVQAYRKEMEAILARGTQRLWELVEMDIKDSDGTVNTKRGELLLKAIQEVANRTKGMATQKIQQESKTLRVNVNQPAKAQQESLEQMRQRLARLKGKEVKQVSAVTKEVVIDAEVTGEPEVILVGVSRHED